MKYLKTIVLVCAIISCSLQVFAFTSEKEIVDFAKKNVNVTIDFNRSKGAIVAIPKKVVIAGINIKYVQAYQPAKIGNMFGGALGMVAGAAISGTGLDKMKQEILLWAPYIEKTFAEKFKSAKIEVLPLDTASKCKVYQDIAYNTTAQLYMANSLNFSGEPYTSSYGQVKVPGEGFKFVVFGQGEAPKKLYPQLRQDAEADGVMLITITLLKRINDDVHIGDCMLEVYAPNKAVKDADVPCFVVNIKPQGEGSKVGMLKQDWKIKDSKDNDSKEMSQYINLITKPLQDYFESYGYILDASIK